MSIHSPIHFLYDFKYMLDLMIQKPSDLLDLSSLEDENLIFS
jgi:hypothetical protein